MSPLAAPRDHDISRTPTEDGRFPRPTSAFYTSSSVVGHSPLTDYLWRAYLPIGVHFDQVEPRAQSQRRTRFIVSQAKPPRDIPSVEGVAAPKAVSVGLDTF
jgi:hypothetical protein